MPQSSRKSSKSKKTSAQNRKIARIAKNVIYKNTETKLKMAHFNELNLSSTTPGTFYDPMIISEGTGPDQRIGNNISLSGYHLKGVFHNNNVALTSYVRMALFYTTDRDQVTTASELFIDQNHSTLTGSTIGGLDLIYHPFNKSKVKVLYNKVHKLGPNDGSQGSHTKFFNMFVKLRNRKIEFEHGTSGNASNVSPRLHLGVWVSTANDDNDIGVELSSMGRLWYKDN